jgi:hypothetical protein
MIARWLEKLGGSDVYPNLLRSLRRVAFCSIANEDIYWMVRATEDDIVDVDDPIIYFDPQAILDPMHACSAAMANFIKNTTLHHLCTSATFGPLALPNKLSFKEYKEGARSSLRSPPSVAAHIDSPDQMPIVSGTQYSVRITRPLWNDSVALIDSIDTAARNIFDCLVSGLYREDEERGRPLLRDIRHTYHISVFADLNKTFKWGDEELDAISRPCTIDGARVALPLRKQHSRVAQRLQSKLRAMFARELGGVDVTITW